MTTMSGWKRRACSMASADGAGLGDDLEALAPVEQRDEALADDLVVVDDEQAQDGAGCESVMGRLSGHRVGERRTTRQSDDDTARPAPARCSIASVPADAPRRGRACCRARGAPDAAASTSGSKPRPSSSTRSSRPSPSRAERDARPGRRRAWRATLLSASRAIWRSSCDGRSGRHRASARRRPSSPARGRATALIAELLGQRRERRDRGPRPGELGPEAEMKLRMSRIVRLSESMARSTRALASAGRLVDQVGHVLERQAHARRSPG